MASADILDFERLLAPIPGDRPGGSDLRQDASANSVYYQLKDARSAARTAERRAAEEALDDPQDEGAEPRGVPAMVSEWYPILDLAPTVLAEQSKDLEVVAWLTEALTRAYGIAGVRDGLRLTTGLVQTFWDDLHPAEDGVEDKVAPMTNLNGTGSDGALVQAIRNVPITDGVPRFAPWHYQTAHRGGGAVTREQFDASVRDTPPAFFADLADDVQAALAGVEACSAAFYEKCGNDAPPTSLIRGVLEDVRDILRVIAPGAETAASAGMEAAPESVTAAIPGGAAPAAATPAAGATLAATEVRTREEAFAALLKLADFFRRTEPHSPISYAIEEVVRRGRMPLHQLLEQLLPEEQDARRMFLVRAGINPPEQTY